MEKRDGSEDVAFVVCVKSGSYIYIYTVLTISYVDTINPIYIVQIYNSYASNYANTGTVCTSQSVAACSDDAKDCESFKPPADEDFAMMFPEAYAKVCEEESGELCLYTDVEYDMCEEAKTSQ